MFNSLPAELKAFPIRCLRPIGRRVFIAEIEHQRFAVILGRQQHKLMVLELLQVHSTPGIAA